MRKRSWSDKQLVEAVHSSRSYRNVLKLLHLVPAGGNYEQIKRRISELDLNTAHFTGKGWNVSGKGIGHAKLPLTELLQKDTRVQSYKLKKRLLHEGVLESVCSLCGWNEKSEDGRIPIELDHINGDRYDNRLENLRILCPNCHSLQPTHRGLNKRK